MIETDARFRSACPQPFFDEESCRREWSVSFFSIFPVVLNRKI